MKPTEGWQWGSDWEVLFDMHTDTEGWSYFNSFTSKQGENKGSLLNMVRKRKWMRSEVPRDL
jgi:hypothetical protein